MRGVDALRERGDWREREKETEIERERGGAGVSQVQKGVREGRATVVKGGRGSSVEDLRGAVGTSGLDDLLLWPHCLVLLCLALAHVDDHAGRGLCPRVEFIFLT